MTFLDRVIKRAGSKFFSIGSSSDGRPIVCYKVGSGEKSVIITAAIHARERHTAFIVCEQINSFKPKADECAYFLPLVNPDGAAFCEGETDLIGYAAAKFVDTREYFKANADCVDLNVNFDARWGSGSSNVTHIAPENYIGSFPLCAKETRALADFTAHIAPLATISYHSMGRELYWEFFQNGDFKEFCRRVATDLAQKAQCKRVDGDGNSAGGYKDWCVQNSTAGFTVETVKEGAHPLSEDDYREDIELNRDMPRTLFDSIYRHKNVMKDEN